MKMRRLLTGRALIAGLTLIGVGLVLFPLLAEQTPVTALMMAKGSPIPSATRAPTRTPTTRPTRTPTLTPTPSSTPLPAKGQLYDIQWSPDSKVLYVFSSSGLWRYTSDPWSKRPTVSVPASAFGPQSNYGAVPVPYAVAHELIATVGRDRVIRLWDPRDGTLKNALPALDADVNGLAFSPDETLLVASTKAPAGAIYIWDLTTSLLLATLPGDQPTNANYDLAPNFTFSADSQTLIYITRTGEIVEWLRAANLVRSTAQQGNFIASRDGLLLAIPDMSDNVGDAAVSIFDVQANAISTTIHSTIPFQVMAFSADNRSLYALSDKHFWHWSLADGTKSVLIRLIDTRDTEAGLYYNSARNFLAHVSQFGRLSDLDPLLEVHVQSMDSGSSYLAQAWVTAWGEQQGTPVAFSPDGNKLAVAGHNGVQMWDVDTGQTLAFLTGYADLVN